MRKLFGAFWGSTQPTAKAGDGGFTSRGAKDVNSYSEPPPPPPPLPGGGGSGSGGGHLRITRDQLKGFGFDETMVNAFSQSAVLNGRLADYLNALARASFEAKNPGKEYKNEHMPGEYVFDGPNNPQSGSVFGRVYKKEGKPAGEYHFSKQEFQELAKQLQFQFQVADETVQVVVHRQLALPGEPIMEERFKKNPRTHAVEYNINQDVVPQYVADARARLGHIFEITVSHTIGGAQQVIVPKADKNMQYSNREPIANFLKWLYK